MVAREKDFSWAAISVIAIQAANSAYQQHIINERARIAEYNRWQAEQRVSRHNVFEDRNGRFSVSTPGGRSVSIDAGTAQLLKNNPGLTVTSTQRRGNGFAVYDRYGNLVKRSNNALPAFAVTARVPIDISVSMKDIIQQAQDRSDAMEIGRLGNPYNAFLGI